MKKTKYGLLFALASMVLAGCSASIKKTTPEPTNDPTPSVVEPTHHEHTPTEVEPTHTEHTPSENVDPTKPNPTPSEGPENPTPSVVVDPTIPTPTDIVEGREEVNLLFSSDPILLANFANSVEVAINQLNSAEGIQLNSNFDDVNLRLDINETIKQRNYEDGSFTLQNYKTGAAISDATLYAEAGFTGWKNGNTNSLFGYIDVNNFNANVSGYFDIDESVETPDGVPHEGEFNYVLNDGAANATLQNREVFMDFSDTNLVSFANSILTDDLFDFKQIIGIDDPHLENILDKYDVSTKVRSGELFPSYEYDSSKLVLAVTAQEILNVIEYLNGEEMANYRPMIEMFMNLLNFKTYQYDANSKFAYGLSISLPNVAALKGFVDYLLPMFGLQEMSSDALLAMYGIDLQSFFAEIDLILAKDGTVSLGLELNAKGSMNSDNANAIHIAGENESGLAHIDVDAELSIKNVSTLSFPHGHDVLEHQLSENEQKTYLHRCFGNHHFTSKTETIDSCHEKVTYYCTVCGYVSSEHINEHHDYRLAYKDGNVVSTCSKCHEQIVHETHLYVLNDNQGSPVDFKVTGAYKFFVFTPEESGMYLFASESNKDTYGVIYNSNFELLASNDDDGKSMQFCVGYELEAGQTYFVGARLLSQSETREYDCKLKCYFNQCYGRYHFGQILENVRQIDSCHSEITHYCSLCGETYESYYSTHHNVDWDNPNVEVIDSCHSQINYTCLNCGELVDYHISTNHQVDYENPTVTQISACQTLYEYKCTVCGEVCDTRIDENHDLYQEREPIDENSYYLITRCHNCDYRLENVFYLVSEFPVNFVIKYAITYFEFTPSENGVYRFESRSSVDTYGYLYDADLNYLTSNDDDAGQGQFRLEYRLEAGQTYYIGARLYSDQGNSGYECSIVCEMARCENGNHIGTVSLEEEIIDACHTHCAWICDACGEIVEEYNETKHVNVDWNNPVREDIDQCHTNYTYYCLECGEVADQYTSTNHTCSNVIESVVDQCHTEYLYYCDNCGELYYHYTDTHHTYGETIVTEIEPCVYLYQTYCTVCNELVNSYTETHHEYVKSEVQIDDNHFQKVYTCSKCNDSYAIDFYRGLEFPIECQINGTYTYFEFVPEESGYYSFTSKCSSDTYGVICDSEMNELNSNDDGAENCQFYVSYQLEAGEIYYIGARILNQDADYQDCVIYMEEAKCSEGNHLGDLAYRYIYPDNCHTIYEEYCTYCGEVLVREEHVEHKNIDWNNEIIEQVGCTVTHKYVCLDCGEEYIDHVESNHDYSSVRIDQIDENHYQEVHTCVNCGDSYAYDYYNLGDSMDSFEFQVTGRITYFVFTPSENGEYTFSSTSNVDTYGYLYDSDMNALTYNDDGAGNSQFSFTWYLEAGQTYYIAVRLYSSSDTNYYNCVLNINH